MKQEAKVAMSPPVETGDGQGEVSTGTAFLPFGAFVSIRTYRATPLADAIDAHNAAPTKVGLLAVPERGRSR